MPDPPNLFADVYIEQNKNSATPAPGNQLLDFSNLGNETSFNTSIKRSLKLQLPKMDSTYEKSPEVFLGIFEKRLVLENIDRTHWKSYLGAALDKNEHRMWYNQLIELSTVNRSWEEIKKMVVEKFSHKDKKQESIRMISTIAQGANEPAKKYIDRFISLIYDAGLNDDASALYAFGRGVKPKHRSMFHGMTPVWKITSLSQAYQLLITIDRNDLDSEQKPAVKCSNCGKNNHTADKCWHLQRNHSLNNQVDNRFSAPKFTLY